MSVGGGRCVYTSQNVRVIILSITSVLNNSRIGGCEVGLVYSFATSTPKNAAEWQARFSIDGCSRTSTCSKLNYKTV